MTPLTRDKAVRLFHDVLHEECRIVHIANGARRGKLENALKRQRKDLARLFCAATGCEMTDREHDEITGY